MDNHQNLDDFLELPPSTGKPLLRSDGKYFPFHLTQARVIKPFSNILCHPLQIGPIYEETSQHKTGCR